MSRFLEPGPLRPDPTTAHDWLRAELLKSEYHPGLLERVKDWFDSLFQKAQTATGNAGGFSQLVLLLVVVGLVVLIAVVLSRLRRVEGTVAESASVFDDVRRSAAAHRQLARAGLDAGDWESAVVEGMRALTAELVERGLVDDVPAATAHEVTAQAAPRFPGFRARLDAGARDFDETRYGGRRATRDQATAMIELDRELRAAAPAASAGPPGPIAAVPR